MYAAKRKMSADHKTLPGTLDVMEVTGEIAVIAVIENTHHGDTKTRRKPGSCPWVIANSVAIIT